MIKCLPTVCVIGVLLSSTAIAQEWTKEETASGMRKLELTRRVPAGKQRAFEDLTFLNTDCSNIEAIEIVITKEPEHGTATIDTIERYPAYPKDSARAKCNDRKVKAYLFNYKSGLDYAGDDQFEVQVLNPNGTATEYVYHVKVIGPSRGGRADTPR
jgi:hypothetical protein